MFVNIEQLILLSSKLAKMLKSRILGILNRNSLTYSSAKTGIILLSADILTQFVEIKNSQGEQKQDFHRHGRFALIGSILIVS